MNKINTFVQLAPPPQRNKSNLSTHSYLFTVGGSYGW